MKHTYYIVSLRKFSILFFLTFGLYSTIWLFFQWKGYRSYSGRNIWPASRSIFNIFYIHSLYKKIQTEFDKREITHKWYPFINASLFVVFVSTSNFIVIIDDGLRETFNALDVVSLLCFFGLYLSLLMPQHAVNILESDSKGKSNNKLTLINYLWIIPGSIVMTFYIITSITLISS